MFTFNLTVYIPVYLTYEADCKGFLGIRDNWQNNFLGRRDEWVSLGIIDNKLEFLA